VKRKLGVQKLVHENSSNHVIIQADLVSRNELSTTFLQSAIKGLDESWDMGFDDFLLQFFLFFRCLSLQEFEKFAHEEVFPSVLGK
jgi:hypothetical protein